MKESELLEILKKLEKLLLDRVVSLNLEQFQSLLNEVKKHTNLEIDECKKDHVKCDVKKNTIEKIKTREDIVNRFSYNPFNQSFSIQLYNLNKNYKENQINSSSTYYLNLVILRDKNGYNLNLTLEKILLLRDEKCYPLYDECSHDWNIILLEKKLKIDEETQKIIKYYLNLYNMLHQNLMFDFY